ncbi:MAG: ankyrin repeat domain-containing protein [Comamonas sp.]
MTHFSRWPQRLAAWTLLGASFAAQAAIDQAILGAVMQDRAPLIAQLAARGADLNGADARGNAPLHVAILQESWQAAQALAGLPGTDVNRANASGETPLMLAALKGRLELVQQLIARDAYVNREGWTPLHYAASGGQAGQPAIVRLLLDHYAFINARSPNETTPLMMAAGYGSIEVVRLLIDEGAFVDVRNQQGMSALDFAQRANRADVAEVITRAQRAAFTQGHW